MHLSVSSVAVLVLLAFVGVSFSSPLPAPSPVVTQEQYEKSVKMLRNVCQPKSGITDEMLARLRAGELVHDQKAYCYTACIMTTTMVLKNNKVDSKMFKAQVKKMMETSIAEKFINAFTICEGTPSGADPCQTAELYIACLNKADPTIRVPA